MQQPMHDVQFKLVYKRISELACVTPRGLRTNKNFAVLKRDYVSRTRLLKELPMQ
ncbi:MAG: hypothetical protein M3R29_04660 [Verrucomicrobiota bacterium]|nr:hypothetical protein [Verrucomicrobiota bacterium]